MERDVLEQHLAEAEQHVAEGWQHIERQEALIAEIDRKGYDAAEARKVLATLRDTQTIYEQEVERLLRAKE
jgi:uncharacterized membrane protein